MRTRHSLAAMAAFALGAASAPATAAEARGLANPLRAPAAAPAAEATQIEALQQRLLASQQVIATLQRELADAKSRTVALDQCRVKNGRLVSIGRQLIEGFELAYRKTHNDPFQLGRRRFEFELQAMREAIYDSHVDVPLKSIRTSTRDAAAAPAAPPPAAELPAAAPAAPAPVAPAAPAGGRP